MEELTLITIPEIAKRFRVTRQHLAKLVRDGVLPKPLRLGRCLRFRPADVAAALERLASENAVTA